jgi:hypothetical protein
LQLVLLVDQDFDLSAQPCNISLQLLDVAEEVDQALVFQLALDCGEASFELILDVRQAHLRVRDSPAGFFVVEKRRAHGQCDERQDKCDPDCAA